MRDSLFNSENISDSPFCWWMGQIVDDSIWKDNGLASKWKGPENISGWGTRYAVRIFGKHSESEISDNQLEWAEVLFPVTAGSGHGGSYETSNLKKGSFVFGFYKDGMDKSEPIIMGCIGNSDQTKLSQVIPEKGFVPFSGYVSEKVSVNSIPGEGSCPPSGTQPRESNTQSSTKESLFCDKVQKDTGEKPIKVLSSSECNKIPLGNIQTSIKNFIIDIQNFKKSSSPCSWSNSILKPIKENGQEYSLPEYISYKAENISKEISGAIKGAINFIQTGVLNLINDAMKDVYSLFMPNQRGVVRESVNTVWDLVVCLFRRIAANLVKMITKLLLQIAEKFINAPLCAIENAVSSLVGQILNYITSSLDSILKSLEALTGAVFGTFDSILDFVSNSLSFISCDDLPDCPEMIEWTSWKGPTKFNLSGDITKITQKIQNIAASLPKIEDLDNFNFDLNFDDILNDSTCNVGPILCGPPTIGFYGGGGSGAEGNLIISVTGEILGVDLVSSGSGYSSSPTVIIEDACGKGIGAVATAIVEPVPVAQSTASTTGGTATDGGTGGTTNGVNDVIINYSGTGYIINPTGDVGGEGRVWADYYQTYVKRKNGNYDRPYDPGETFDVNPGDIVNFPSRPRNEISIMEKQIFTAPEPIEIPSKKEGSPSLDKGTYPVFLELKNLAIKSPGINYDPNDEIEIIPNYGAKVKASFSPSGSITKVEVISPGIGFTEMPTIRVKTKTGYNASLLPVFKVNRLNDIPDGQDPIVPPNQIISVVDCVGKINV